MYNSWIVFLSILLVWFSPLFIPFPASVCILFPVGTQTKDSATWTQPQTVDSAHDSSKGLALESSGFPGFIDNTWIIWYLSLICPRITLIAFMCKRSCSAGIKNMTTSQSLFMCLLKIQISELYPSPNESEYSRVKARLFFNKHFRRLFLRTPERMENHEQWETWFPILPLSC